jgi:hypothetical protein
MSLNWSLEDIKDCDDICWIDDPESDDPDSKRMNPVTDSLIWHTMAVGIGNITEANVDEFYWRSKFYTGLFGGMIRSYNEDTGNWENRDYTATEIRDHIGLSTNVSYESEAKWRNRMVKNFKREVNYQRDLDYETKKAKKEEVAA